MTRNEKGFTLIELMIVIAIIAIIAAIAIPNLLAARLSANETAAIATLRSISSAQAQYQQSGKADNDDDGTGEYGGFAELSGALQGRMTGGVLVPAVLSGSFRTMTAGRVSRSGYLFQMFLPLDATGAGSTEPDATGFTDALVDDDLGETTWCCYAWPVNYNQSGNRTFFVNQGGDVLGCEGAVAPYNGTLVSPVPASAFDPASTAPGMLGNVAIAIAGNDGFTWKQVN